MTTSPRSVPLRAAPQSLERLFVAHDRLASDRSDDRITAAPAAAPPAARLRCLALMNTSFFLLFIDPNGFDRRRC